MKNMFRFCSSVFSIEVHITLSFSKRAVFIVVFIRFCANCRLVFIKHVANSKKITMHSKFTILLDIYRKFSVNHTRESVLTVSQK